ncbi:hypothetical protein BaRGS_00007401 [Batillaria attramentaria]|uniref:Secreted protein n=1 Tax=Batillaria attramentaria TaxID=370345 RepID=A0ABD0LPU8_9CAEN
MLLLLCSLRSVAAALFQQEMRFLKGSFSRGTKNDDIITLHAKYCLVIIAPRVKSSMRDPSPKKTKGTGPYYVSLGISNHELCESSLQFLLPFVLKVFIELLTHQVEKQRRDFLCRCWQPCAVFRCLHADWKPAAAVFKARAKIPHREQTTHQSTVAFFGNLLRLTRGVVLGAVFCNRDCCLRRYLQYECVPENTKRWAQWLTDKGPLDIC